MHRSMVCAVVLTVALAVAGCAEDSTESTAAAEPTAGPTATTSPRIAVVASTNVYGDIASRIGGDRVEVASIIDGSADQDPHSFEVSPRDQLAISRADLVIQNGGHYDEFMARLLSATGGERRLITAIDTAAAGHSDGESTTSANPESTSSPTSNPSSTAARTATSSATPEGVAGGADEHAGEDARGHSGENEHVWYDLAAMGALADEIAGTLADLDPNGRALFESNAESFQSGLADLTTRQEAIKVAHGGAGIAITEPVPLLLLADAGLVNKTSADFSEAIEEGTDAPARVLAETLALFSSNAVEALVYNDQTTGPQTEAVREAASSAGIPIVAVSETLPADLDYLSWMGRNLDALQDALD